MAKPRVLLVDDEKEFREILAERLVRRGLDVEMAESGPVALDMADKESYDAIILDLAMPEMDGLEVLEHLLEKNPNHQVIVLTGRATVEKGVQAVKMGAVDFLEKPAEIEPLVKKVEEAQARMLALFEEDLDRKISDITRKRGW